MRRPSLALATLATLAALLASGCGSGQDSHASDQEAEKACQGARRTLEAYLKALKEGDCEAAYATLSWGARKTLTLEELKKDYAGHKDRYQHLSGGKIENPLYDGFRVLAKLVTGEGRNEFISLIPEAGQWRIEETGRNYADLYGRVFSRGRKAAGP